MAQQAPNVLHFGAELIMHGRTLERPVITPSSASRRQGDADLALRLEAADAGAVAGARVDHDERPFLESTVTPSGGVMRTRP